MVRRKITAVVKALAGAVLVTAAGAAYAATPVVTGSGSSLTLTGANDVSINGSTYNVEFVDGSCNGLFGGCSSSNFSFSDPMVALGAANALLDQVLIAFQNVGNFENSPNLTQGCSDPHACSIYIPYASSDGTANVAIATNVNAQNNPNNPDGAALGTVAASTDTTGQSQFTYARFTASTGGTPNPSSVPEPSTWLLMMAGFGIAGLALRRNVSSDRRVVFA